MDETIGIIQSDFKDLRSKTSTGGNIVKFNKHILGGFKTVEVEEYIASLTQQFGRTEDAYKERIEEFTTFTEMLTKEKDNATIQLQTALNELNEYKKEILALKEQTTNLYKDLENSKTISLELTSRESEITQKEDENISLSIENKLLKSELCDINLLRDKLAGEDVVLKKKLEVVDNLATTAHKENNLLRDKMVLMNSTIRQVEMKKSLKLSEYTEKQIFTINQTTQSLKDMFSTLEDMKMDVCEMFEELKENKFICT